MAFGFFNSSRRVPVILSALVLFIGFSGKGLCAAPGVTVGGAHSVAVKSDGTVWAWGNDTLGQLGQNRPLSNGTPATTNGLPPVIKLASGMLHNLALARDGRVWAWGSNGYGELGDTDPSTTLGRTTPAPVPGPTNIIGIAAGTFFSVALKSDGSVWAWGRNNLGQLGDGSAIDRASPIQINGLSGIVAIAAGESHSLALKKDGSVWAWGFNGQGQLGDGTTTSRLIPVQVSGLSGVTALAAGGAMINSLPTGGHSLARTSDGKVWAWGWNQFGQIGDGSATNHATPVQVPGLTGITSLAAGGFHSLVLGSDGSVWMWGIGSLSSDGKTARSLPVQISGISDIVSLVAGAAHSLAVKRDGSLWAWGTNSFEQLGDGTNTSRSTPVQLANLTGLTGASAGYSHSLALTRDGAVVAWGGNSFFQLGTGAPSSPTPVQVTGMSGTLKVTAAGTHTIALKGDGTLWAWGANINGELGDGSINTIRTAPVQVKNVSGAVDVATCGMAGPGHSLAIKSDGSLWAWGANTYGQLGDGSFTDRPSPITIARLSGVTKLACGDAHSVALRSDGAVWTWGDNSVGQLGEGGINGRATPAQVTSLSGVVALTSGFAHTLALMSDGSVRTWGLNANGQLGDGSTTNRASPVRVANLSGVIAVASGLAQSFALKNDGSVWAWGFGYFGGRDTEIKLVPAQVQGLSGVAGLAPGTTNNLALLTDGSVRAWGSNRNGQLGDGTYATHVSPTVVVNNYGSDLLDLDPTKAKSAATQLLSFLLVAKKTSPDLSIVLSDPRAGGFNGDLYFSALLPPNSSLLTTGNGFAISSVGAVPVTLGRGGVKQSGPNVAATPVASGNGTLTAGNSFAAYSGMDVDPLKNSNAIICVGITVPELSAKGQVLMRVIANGDSLKGVAQCPTVQTPATLALFRASTSGTLSNLTLTATITPQQEDRGQTRNIYSWAVAPDGTQFMQTPSGWALMTEPMQAAKTFTVPSSGNVTLPVTTSLDLSSLAGTLAYVGLGSSWEEVRNLNKAGHYYTVQ